MHKKPISGRTTDPRWPHLLLLSPKEVNQVSGGLNPQPLPPGRARDPTLQALVGHALEK